MCQPDKHDPEGKDIDASFGSAVTCTVTLPYPAKRCGAYVVKCLTCGTITTVTTAGRVDDPRSLKLACRLHKADPSEQRNVH